MPPYFWYSQKDTTCVFINHSLLDNLVYNSQVLAVTKSHQAEKYDLNIAPQRVTSSY